MKIAIMQPYFIPYIGYFQLINSVDKFVILDNVNFIKGGWINRNIIAEKGVSSWLTIPLVASSPNKLINEIEIINNDFWKSKMIKTIKQIYGNSHERAHCINFITNIIYQANGNLSKYLINSIYNICELLHIKVDIISATSSSETHGLTSQERIISICKEFGANTYINSPGGKSLYDVARFRSNNIELKFIESGVPLGRLTSGLNNSLQVSIIDLLMRNPIDCIQDALGLYNLS